MNMENKISECSAPGGWNIGQRMRVWVCNPEIPASSFREWVVMWAGEVQLIYLLVHVWN